MRRGALAYQAEIQVLQAAGIPVAFTQTGAMNAALEAVLDGGAVLLVTDAEDRLAWDRAEQQGWAAGVYRSTCR